MAILPGSSAWHFGVAGVVGVAMVVALVTVPTVPSELTQRWIQGDVERSRGAIVHSAVNTKEGLIAVGQRRAGDRIDAAVWRSKDGVHWDIVQSEDLSNRPSAVVTTHQQMTGIGESKEKPGMLVAGGTEWSERGSRVVFWNSTDGGRSWTRVAHDDEVMAPATVEEVSGFKKEWLAVGNEGADGSGPGVIWHSTDGNLWARYRPDDLRDLYQEQLYVVALGKKETLYAGGISWDAGPGGHRRPASPIWSSTDARKWTQVPDATGELTRAVHVVRGIVQTEFTTALVEIGGEGGAMAFLSHDGKKWHRAGTLPLPAGATVRIHDLEATPDEWMAAAGTVTHGGGLAEPPQMKLWVSHDAVVWEELEDPVLETEATPKDCVASTEKLICFATRGPTGQEESIVFVHSGLP